MSVIELEYMPLEYFIPTYTVRRVWRRRRARASYTPEVEMEENGKGHSSRRVLSPLPAWARFYFYGMHGLLDEVVFTALFDLLLEPHGNPQLKGCSTLTSFFMYGSCSFIMEHIFIYGKRRGFCLGFRLPIYVLAAYTWEFTWGMILRQFDACSWDYSHYPYNLLGLITLVYAPGWIALGLIQDCIYNYLFSLHIVDGPLYFKED